LKLSGKRKRVEFDIGHDTRSLIEVKQISTDGLYIKLFNNSDSVIMLYSYYKIKLCYEFKAQFSWEFIASMNSISQ